MRARHLPTTCLCLFALSGCLLSLNKAQHLSTSSSSSPSSFFTTASSSQMSSQEVDKPTHQGVSNISKSLCGTEITLEDGEAIRFQSPGFPDHYPNFSLCSWRVNAAENGDLSLQCGVFNLESCSFFGDALYVVTDYFWLINRYCGKSSPMTPRKASSYFHFVFWSYYTEQPSDSVTGFDCTVRAQREDGVEVLTEDETFRDCGWVNRPNATSARVARSPGHAKNHWAPTKKSSVAGSKNAENANSERRSRTRYSWRNTVSRRRMLNSSTIEAESALPFLDTEAVEDDGKRLALRVVGGEETFPNEYPWQAALVLGRSLGVYPFCGASLISSKWVLTAAHCIYEAEEKEYDYKVLLGAHDTGSIIEVLSHHLRATIKRKIMHPEFNYKTIKHDIGLLELEERLPLSKTIRPVCLPSGPVTYSGITATVSGWGVTQEGATRTSRVLQSAELEVLSTFKCHLSYFFYISDKMLCARAKGKDACQGDSGGPLTARLGDLKEEMQRRRARANPRPKARHPKEKEKEEEEEGQEEEELSEDDLERRVQIGIVSWGKGCAKYSYPGVYTRVDKYLDWLIYYLGEEEVCYV
ncbi:uncharacterized protein LOC143039700 [Oratosquilla oratoria]|uniref:uncharacterized protein LOC143039700 n=1 Tax=Oratosquilla oratoria TaxID=337810 RepID=UPI003F758459